jgi:phospholipid/cholesterol/gamma-HCH transport system substrate-binding protein
MIDRDKKTEMLVGLFVLVGLLLLGGLILQFGRVREIFKDTYTLRVAFPNASGIKEGSPVYLGGSRVGKVNHNPALNATFTGVIIDLEIFKEVMIPADATFSIGSAGLMGDALVEIKSTGKETKDFIAHDRTDIISGAQSGGLSDLQSQAEVVAKKVDIVLDDVRTALNDVKGSMSKINNGALSDSTIQDFKDSMEHLNNTMTRVDEKVLGEENAANLKSALIDIKEAAASFKQSALHVEQSTQRLEPMFNKLDPAIAKADKVMSTADESLQSIKKAADSFALAARNITTGKGLLGALMNDPELKDEFSGLISNLKRNGVIFYRDNADKLKPQEKESPLSHEPKRKSVFGR